MELVELQNRIVHKTIPNFLVLTGSEVGIMDIYLNKIYGVVDKVVNSVDNVQEAYSRMKRKSMLSDKRLFVVRNDDSFIKQEKVWETVLHEVDGETNSLILIFSNLDKRSKFYKEFTPSVVEFQPVSPEILVRYVEKELPGTTASAKARLVEVCEGNYSRILLECDKVRQYTAAKNDEFETCDYSKAIRLLIDKGIIYQPIGDITFKLTDAILTRNIPEIGYYMLQARLKGEPEIMVLSILYNSFKQILLVQGLGPDASEPSKRTGLTPWQVKMAKEKMGHYSVSELINILKEVRFAEVGIKTGQLDADIALDYLIAKIVM